MLTQESLKDELVKLRDEVKNEVLNQLEEDSLDVLNESLADLNKYIEVKIESQLAILKNSDMPVYHTNIEQK